MSKYIDADRLKAEIERRNLSNRYITTEGYEEELYEIIDSLQQEQPEVDLEEEIAIYPRTFSSSFENGIEYTKNIARHFYELGKNAK